MLIQKPAPEYPKIASYVLGTIIAHSEMQDKAACRELAQQFWDQIKSIYKHRIYHNLSLIEQSVDMLPPDLFLSTVDMPYVVLAFALQWMGPASNPDHNYCYYKLNKVLGWPERKARIVQDLAKVRLDLSMPTFAPKSTMYDLNLVRLAVPTNEFLANQEHALKHRHESIGMDDFLSLQTGIFNLLLRREHIYASSQCRHLYEMKARANLTAYLNKLSRPTESKKIQNLALTV